MTAPKKTPKPPAVKRVFLSEKVPSKTSNTRLLAERSTLELGDVEGGFTVGNLGVSYGFDGRTFIVPWASVRYLECEEPEKPAAKKKPAAPTDQTELTA